MLVLSRQRDETVVLKLLSGQLIRVTVVDIRGDKVRLGFDAPPNVAVNREEIHNAIERGEVRE